MDLKFLRLWDIYNSLLTEHQREVTDLYFNCDLSLAEIAEEKGCSRQSVSDTLQKVRRQLEEYEEKLHFSRLLTEVSLAQSLLLTKVGEWAQAHLSGELCGALHTIVDHDYTEEVKALLDKDRETRQ